MGSTPSSGYTESLGTKMDRLAEALTDGRAALRAEGVYVDVHANGHVRAVVIDDEMVPGARQLGALIAELINAAREQAQAQVEVLVGEVAADPRVVAAVEQLGDAPERALPTAVADRRRMEEWDDDEDLYHRGKSRISAPED